MKTDGITSNAAGVSRRNFLMGLGAVSAGAAAVAAASQTERAYADEPASEETPSTDGELKVFDGMELAWGHIAFDPDLCAGCRCCEIVCSLSHFDVVNTELSAIRINTDILGGYISDVEACRQCPGAECVAVCPTGANHIDPNTGARVIDRNVCIGCQMCLNACPCTPSRIHYNEERNVCFKCDLCGGDPLCVKHCSGLALSCSWIEPESTEVVVETDCGITLNVDVTGSIIVIARDSITVYGFNAVKESPGVKVSGAIISAYTQPFEAKIKATYFDANGEVLLANDRLVIPVASGGSATFEDVYETSNPDAVASCHLEVMCGKIAG